MTTDSYLDRRAYPRYPTRDSRAVVLSPENIIYFILLDVSKSGLAFSYNCRSLNRESMYKAVIDFFCEKIGTTDLPVDIISDTEIDNSKVWYTNEDHEASTSYLRRCGVKFGELSDAQELALEQFVLGVRIH